jgi:hypothetical protein
MSILTHNIFRLFANDMERYHNISDQSVFEKFIDNSADVKIGKRIIYVRYKKKRNLPLLLQKIERFEEVTFKNLNNFKIKFSGATYS